MFRGHIEQDMRNLHDKYGPIVRVGPNSLSISHPDVTKVIWGEGSKITKVSHPRNTWPAAFACLNFSSFTIKSQNSEHNIFESTECQPEHLSHPSTMVSQLSDPTPLGCVMKSSMPNAGALLLTRSHARTSWARNQ